MKVKKTENTDGTFNVELSDMTIDDLKHLYCRSSLINQDITDAMGSGFGDKKLPEISFGCEFGPALNDIWD